MIKFSNILYKRPDAASIAIELQQLINNTKAAVNGSALKKCIFQQVDLLEEWNEMTVLSIIRNRINMADSFYIEEEKYFAQHKPEIEKLCAEFFETVFKHEKFEEVKHCFTSVFVSARTQKNRCVNENAAQLLKKENELGIRYREYMTKAKTHFAALPAKKTSDDRMTRKQAWIQESEYYEKNSKRYLDLYDEFVSTRTKIATALGFENFTEVGYLRNVRTCYDKVDVKRFRDQVKKHVVPFVTELKNSQSKNLNLDKFRFYDFYALFSGGNPIPNGGNQGIYNALISFFQSIDKTCASYINTMDKGGFIDVFPSPDRMGGAFCRFLPREKIPFVFGTMDGESGDVAMLAHELGHGYASYVSRNDTSAPFFGSSSDIDEVPAMTMEFLAWKIYPDLYKDVENKAKFSDLVSAFSNLPYMCMVDEFQHEVYDNPRLSIEQRNEVWKKLETEYRPYMDWEDAPLYSKGMAWIRQEHIFTHPFYYIDYALAQIVTLQFFSEMQKSWQVAFEKYDKFCRLCGKKNFVEILSDSGLQNPMDNGTIESIVYSARQVLQQLEQNF